MHQKPRHLTVGVGVSFLREVRVEAREQSFENARGRSIVSEWRRFFEMLAWEGKWRPKEG